MMNNRIILLCVVLAICGSSCQKKKWTIVQQSSTKIALDSTTEALADREYVEFLQPYKERMDGEMKVVIGRSAQTMRVSQPESLLSNFSADVFREVASDYLKEKVDIGIVNNGGLRTDVPKGEITVGKVFELMPFENELVILWLKGDKLLGLFDVIAGVGGEGVSGIRMGIKDGKAVDATIGGQAVDPEKLYSIATNDYLAGGNDKLVQLAEYEKRVNTGIKVRNMFIDYIKRETAKGNEIKSQLDGRIYEVN